MLSFFLYHRKLYINTLSISFEIMSSFVQISRVKYTDRLYYYTANPTALVSTTLHFSNPALLLRFSYSLMFSCIWDPSSLCVSYLFLRIPFSNTISHTYFVSATFVCSSFTAQSRYQPVRPDWMSKSEQVWSHNQQRLSRESNTHI